MSKSTHIGTLRGFKKLFGNFKPNDPSLEEITFLYDVSNKEHELIKRGECFYLSNLSHDLFFEECDLTNLREIKPEIEIPETPFFYKTKEGRVFLLEHKGLFQHPFVSSTPVNDIPTASYTTIDVFNLINKGTWTICKEPKKEIEIPDGVFWIKASKSSVEAGYKKDQIHRIHLCPVALHGYVLDGVICNRLEYEELVEKLNDGTLEIVDEPKKEMVNVQAYEILNQIAEKFGMKVVKEV